MSNTSLLKLEIRIAVFLFLYINGFNAFSQKEGNNWLQGNYGSGIIFNFNYVITEFSPKSIGLDYANNNSCISDSSGNLLFYTNGIEILDRQNHVLPHGHIAGFTGYPTQNILEYDAPESTFFIPHPGNDSIYYFFKQSADDAFTCSDVFGYGLINKNANNGLGDVISDQNILLSFPDSTNPSVYATRHANGRDWWIIKPGYTNYLYTFLLSPNGIEFIEKQQITKDSTYHILFFGGAFAPSGEKFALISVFDPWYGSMCKADLFDFDRCTGKFSFVERFYNYNAPANESVFMGFTMEFSPNSKLIYVANSQHIFQFDTESQNVSQTADTIANYNGFTDTLSSAISFYSMKLSANNHIYISSGASYYIHEIENPDARGVGCNFNFCKYQFDRGINFRLPHLPNYKLGPIDGSVCDSLGIDNPIGVEERKTEPNFSIYPNPAKGHFFVHSEQNQPCQIQVINALGQLAFKAELKQGKGSVKVNIPPGLQGLFVVEIYQNNQIKERGKLVVEGE